MGQLRHAMAGFIRPCDSGDTRTSRGINFYNAELMTRIRDVWQCWIQLVENRVVPNLIITSKLFASSCVGWSLSHLRRRGVLRKRDGQMSALGALLSCKGYQRNAGQEHLQNVGGLGETQTVEPRSANKG